MSAATTVMLAEMEDGEREILERMDERLVRLDGWIKESANPALVELRAEVEMSRIAYEHQLTITRRVVERYFRATDRLDRTIEENTLTLRETRRTLRETRRTLRALGDSLSGGGNGPGGGTGKPSA